MASGQTRPSFLSRPTDNSTPVGLDRARLSAWKGIQQTASNQTIDPMTDPTGSHWIHQLDLRASFSLYYGRIVDEIPYANCYKIQPERGLTTLWCTALTQTALQPMGSRQIGQIPIGAGVIFVLHQNSLSGIIIGVIPDMQTAGNAAMADFISQQARCGLLVDSAHSYPFSLSQESHIKDWSAGRPFDATTEGEYGQITETGLLNFLDSFMTAHRADETCGIWHFFHDQLTRLAAYNFQLWTAGYEREDKDDEGEVNIIEGYTPFYWESLGAYSIGTVSRDISAADWQKNSSSQCYGAVEPLNDKQYPFFRLKKYHGYLGQGFKEQLCLPPTECTAFGNINLLQDRNIYPGVFENNLDLTGRWAVRSAHEIILSKHIVIPSPKQVVLPEDPQGDKASNYKAASALGSGPNHIVVGEIDVPPSFDEASQIRAAGFLDTFAFVFNWIGTHPFQYHEQDWYMPEESELTYLGDGCAAPQFVPPPYDLLGCQHFIPAPEAIPLRVDHRYGNVDYYPNHSYFGLLADGGIVMGCGFGSEIKLANGHITLSAPGDINLQAGRDVVSLAGYDVILRAKNSWDITATNKDGRLQANRNLMLAATGRCGGVLIQSFADGVYCDFEEDGEAAILGGIMLKADDSLITTTSQNMLFRLSELSDNNVMAFDAGDTSRIKMRGQFIERFLTNSGSALDYWVAGDSGPQCAGTITKGVEWWSDGVLISMPVVVEQKMLVTDNLIVKNDIISTEGHIATFDARGAAGHVGYINPDDSAAFNDTFVYFLDYTTNVTPDIGSFELENLCAVETCDGEFTFRTVEQYKTETYVLFENRWQQIARLSGVPVQQWIELPVNFTYPYPGREILLGATYRTLDPILYNVDTGIAENRDANTAYTAPEFAVPNALILNTNYSVII